MTHNHQQAHEPTILIVGAGTFGVSTAYHLAQAYTDPSRVTLIDREPPPPSARHAAAAAVDISRIIRADYPSAVYCNLANEAMHAWYWSNELGPHYHKVGWLMLDEEGSDLQARIHDTLRARGTHLMQSVALRDIAGGTRWASTEGTDTSAFGRAYFNPDAGWVDAEKATARFMETAVNKGVRRVVGDVVELSVDISTGRVRGVKTRDGRLWTADKIVLAAGAWTNLLLCPVEHALGVTEEDSAERQARATACVSAYFRLSDVDVETMTKVGSEMPCVIYGRAGEVVPAWKGVGMLKYNNSETKIVNTVTTVSGRKISVPPPRGPKTGAVGNHDNIPEGLKQVTEALLTSRLLPRLTRGKRPERWRVCWDSRTPTEDLLLCEHPGVHGLFIITGGSFCGYKFVFTQAGPFHPVPSPSFLPLRRVVSPSLTMLRFLPNIGKYMLNVLNGRGNGLEKDRAWGWKTGAQLAAAEKTATRELSSFEVSAKKSSRL